jgi:hypothetical protein
VAAFVTMLRKLLGLAVSFALFPKPLNLAHAAGAALVFGAGAAHSLARRPPAAPQHAAGHQHADVEEEVAGPEGTALEAKV